jgi:uncharacterized membrane protein
MNKMLVAVFDTESAAFEGLNALKDLHRNGDITLYASAVIGKDNAGKLDVKRAAEAKPIGTAIGLLTGSLIGLVGGPVGMAVGAYVGGLSGLLFDLDDSGVDAGFVDDVSQTLTAGKTAVLADIDEGWTTPVDARMRECGGTVYRRLRTDVVDDQIVRENAAFDASLKALEDELKQSKAESKAAVQKDIDETKKQLRKTQERAKARLDQAKAEMEARIKMLQDQAKATGEQARGRIDKRIAAAKADFDRRSKKLDQVLNSLPPEAFAA